MNFFGADNSQLLTQMTVSFDVEDGQVVRKPFDKTVAQFGKANLEAFARDFGQRQQEAAKRREFERKQQAAVAAEAARKQQEADEKQWAAADHAGCADANTLYACDSVRAYLDAFPNGRHVAEARRAIGEAEPRLKELEAAKAWRAIDLVVCKKAASSDACSPVEEYLTNFPDASNRAEAEALLKQVAPRLKAAQKREQAKADAADDISALCEVTHKLEKLKQAEALRVRVDRKSGTTNLYLKRKIAEGLILFGDKQRALQQSLKTAGVTFRRSECPAPEDDESDDE